MFKYAKYTKVETEHTVLEFRGGSEDVKVNHFDANVVSVEAENESDIDALITQQEAEINCVEIEQDEFKAIVTTSSQINRIREVVAENIAKKYTIADELGMFKRDADDVKRVAYEDYVSKCLAAGYALKAEIGY